MGGIMDSLVQLISNMNSRTRNRAVITITALILPSITYLTLNFPQKMYSSDLIKVLVMGVCINFFLVCISFTLQFIKIMIVYDKTISSLNNALDSLTNTIVKLRENNSKQRTILNGASLSLEKRIITEEEFSVNKVTVSQVEEDLNKSNIILESTENMQKELISYLNDLLDPLRYISESSLVTIIQILVCCLVNIVGANNISFTVKGIFYNVIPYIIFYYFINTIYEYFKKDFRLKHIEKKLEEFSNMN